MAVAHRASAAQNQAAGTTTCTVTIPASVQTDDLLFLVAGSRDATGTDPTVSDDDTGGNSWAKAGGSSTGTITVWWKRATSGTASKTITIADAVGSCTGVVSAYSGGDTGSTPYEQLSVEEDSDSLHASITPTSDGSMVCLLTEAFNDTSITVGPNATSPATLTIRGQGLSTGGNDMAVSFSSEVQSPAGATGQFSWTQVSDAASIAFAIKPSVAGGGGGGPRMLPLLGVG
jgi:hypothetical protein